MNNTSRPGVAGNFFNPLQRGGILNHRDDQHVLVGEIVVAFGRRPSECGQISPGPAQAMRGITAGSYRLAGEFRGAREREDHAQDTGIEQAFGRPKFVRWRTGQRHRGQAACRQNDVSHRLQGQGAVFPFPAK
jgi:hypothetical protein